MDSDKLERWINEGKHVAAVGKLVLRVTEQTGVLWKTRPRGVAVLAQALASGKTNPSTLYRYQAVCQPDKIAVVGHGQRLTFKQLDEQMDSIAAGLADAGLTTTDRVVLMMRNRPELVMLHPAIGRFGASVVAVSWHSTAEELAFVLQNSEARAVFFEHDLGGVVKEAVELAKNVHPELLVSVGGAMDGVPRFDQWVASTPKRKVRGRRGGGAVIAYTSGTTGKPKGAVRTFSAGAMEASFSWVSAAPFSTEDVHLAVLPLYHSTAYAFVNLIHLVGGTVVLSERFTPESFLRAVHEHGVTHTALVPTLLHRLVEAEPELKRRWNTSTLRAILTAGAPLSASLAKQVMKDFGHVLWNYYGATETGLNAVAGPEDLLLSPGTIGRPLPNNELRILDHDGRRVPDGEVGELFVRGPLMIAGYHENEGATRASQRDGFFSVGDLARMDERGCYHIVGRKRDMIISGGVNVYPAEVERELAAHPGVGEIAVVGVPDNEWGERVVAFIVASIPGEPVSADELETFAREHLSGPKRPRAYYFIDEMPRNPTGKLLKRKLREIIEAR